MPSPFGHTLFGLGIYVVWCKNIRFWLKDWIIIIWIIFCANLPDFDIFVGLAVGNMGRYHQSYSHTLGFALVVGILTLIILKIAKSKNSYGIALLTFFTVFFHVVLDSLNCDSYPPIGVRLLWPFSNIYFNPVQMFYPVPHSKISDIFSDPWISAARYEILLLTPPLILLALYKLKRSNGKN